MASWMVHFRIADLLLSSGIGDLSAEHFIVGNIAPDSGEPNEDWSSFTPPTTISHWELNDIPYTEWADMFRLAYLEHVEDTQKKAFYLGYYTHLLTDCIWGREMFFPQKVKYAAEFAKDPDFIWEIKHDMYDLDHLYLREYPDFRAFTIFSKITTFPNIYLDYFSESAIEKKIIYITGFYRNFKGNLDREYPYIKKTDMDYFVENAFQEIKTKVSC